MSTLKRPVTIMATVSDDRRVGAAAAQGSLQAFQLVGAVASGPDKMESLSLLQ